MGNFKYGFSKDNVSQYHWENKNAIFALYLRHNSIKSFKDTIQIDDFESAVNYLRGIGHYV